MCSIYCSHTLTNICEYITSTNPNNNGVVCYRSGLVFWRNVLTYVVAARGFCRPRALSAGGELVYHIYIYTYIYIFTHIYKDSWVNKSKREGHDRESERREPFPSSDCRYWNILAPELRATMPLLYNWTLRSSFRLRCACFPPIPRERYDYGSHIRSTLSSFFSRSFYFFTSPKSVGVCVSSLLSMKGFYLLLYKYCIYCTYKDI